MMMAKSLWRSSKIITKHLHGSNSSFKYSTTILLQRSEPDYSSVANMRKSILSFLTYPGEGEGEAVKFNIDLPVLKYYPRMSVCGHSHGLVCLSNSNYVFLCNPFTKQIRRLPPTILHYAFKSHTLFFPGEFESLPNSVGFGYDPISNDFKVFRSITFHYDSANYDYFGGYDLDRFEIYNLSTNRWREIKTPPLLGHVSLHFYFQFYHEGLYYFLASSEREFKGMIQAFDISEEVFHTIPLPDWKLELEKEAVSYDLTRAWYSYKLCVWNGSIVLLVYPHSDSKTSDENFVYVWVMEKDESWSRILRLGPLPLTIKCPLLFVNSNELLMRDEDGHIVSYNINTQRFNDFRLKIDHLIMFKAFIFEKSMLSVRRGTGLPACP